MAFSPHSVDVELLVCEKTTPCTAQSNDSAGSYHLTRSLALKKKWWFGGNRFRYGIRQTRTSEHGVRGRRSGQGELKRLDWFQSPV